MGAYALRQCKTHPQHVCFLYLSVIAFHQSIAIQCKLHTQLRFLIVAVAQLQSSPKPFTGGDAEEEEQSSEAGIAPHQSASDVQQQLKGLHSRAKSMEHELKMRVSKLDWQREFQAFETDLRAKHACEMRALQVSVAFSLRLTPILSTRN